MAISRRKLLWSAATAVAAGAAGYKLVRGFDDPPGEDFSQTLPAGLLRAALDVHVHILGTGAGGTGCWMHESMRSSLPVRAGLWNLGLRIGQPDLDQRYVDYLLRHLRGAGFLKQAVVLAQDYVYNSGGARDEEHTPFHAPNDYIAQLAAQHPEFLFGASIHPYRPDALDALDRAAAQGAVLVKWIPNVHAIDLADARCRAFYKKLAALRIALLVHAGDEKAMFAAGQQYGDPRRLAAPLEEGVTVIAAHVASLGEREGRSNLDWLAEMFPRWPNLYADTSALTLITRWRRLREVISRAEILPRLIHGSDFPLPPAATMFFGSVSVDRWWDAWKYENPLRRDFLLKRALGMPEEVFRRGYDVLAPRLRVIGR